MDFVFKYQRGFGNHFAVEALPGALPQGQNSPLKVAYGLYAEQLSGTSFTAPRSENLRTWVYRIHPSVGHGAFHPLKQEQLRTAPLQDSRPSPTQMRWDPFPIPDVPTDFIQGLFSLAVGGDLAAHRGAGIHLYSLNRSMEDAALYNADGDFLFVPQTGKLGIRTELGNLAVSPGEIAVIPRGMRFQVSPLEGKARGYLCENYGQAFRLPSLGPIGANGLANARDFLVPEPAFEDRRGNFRVIAKFQGELWECRQEYSPFDVVAWHGNYVPYKYDLSLFNTINTVSFDHPDPSIFTVLTSPSEVPGIANLDFVIFPPRWMVAEHTFRPPYFHRNCMSEYMGLIHGAYDAKGAGFSPGGGSLHNCMSAHGPDLESYEKAVSSDEKPHQLKQTLAFMFESSSVFHPTPLAVSAPQWQSGYLETWKGLKSNFNPKLKGEDIHGK